MMPANTRYFFSAITLFILCSCSGSGESGVDTDTSTAVEYKHIPPSLPDSIYQQIKPGDIIVRRGNGPLSAHIMQNTEEDYSHCGIIVKEGETWRVIHSLGGSVSEQEEDGVQIMDLTEFVKHGADSMLFICRPIFADSLETKIPERAYHYLNLRVPFDHSFSMYSTDEYYCSELLYYIFKDVNDGKNVFIVKKKHRTYMLLFATFFDREKFMPIFHLKDDNRRIRMLPADSLSNDTTAVQ